VVWEAEVDTIVVLDDDKTFAGLLKTVFEMEGHQVVVLSWPDDLLPTARDVRPALVLMDVHAGEGDTLDVVRALRSDEATKAVPIMMTSGMDRRDECLQAGADAFILKPFRPSELLAEVEKLLGEGNVAAA
jgi:DNA-binding response OmpR family regulator